MPAPSRPGVASPKVASAGGSAALPSGQRKPQTPAVANRVPEAQGTAPIGSPAEAKVARVAEVALAPRPSTDSQPAPNGRTGAGPVAKPSPEPESARAATAAAQKRAPRRGIRLKLDVDEDQEGELD